MEIALPPRRRGWIAKQPVEAARDTGGQYHRLFSPPVIVEEEEPGGGGENRIEELGGGAGVLGAFMGRKGI
jgi:hypothetical protein